MTGEHALFEDLSRLNNEMATLQRELVRKNIELARLNEEKNQWLGIAAHDLRSPLGVIQTYSEFLLDEAGPTLSAEHRQFLALIHGTSVFSHRLVNDLLDVAVIESGELRLDLQSLDLATLVETCVMRHRVLAAKKEIQISRALADGLPPLLADAAKLQQVLHNLLDNAIKFSHPRTALNVTLARDATHAVLGVADQGQGIPAEDLARLFKPFGRTRVRGTHGEASTGLGLIIVRRIVEGHHGTVTMQSVVGCGSCVQIRLPLPERNISPPRSSA